MDTVENAESVNKTPTGRHRRVDQNVPVPLKQYEELLVALHGHAPGRRSGLCLCCGVLWPCLEVAGSVPWWADLPADQ